MPHWTALVAEKKQRQLESIPQEWIVTPPPDSTLDVTEFPETCGLLNAREIEITNTSVQVLLEKLARAEWTAVDVTTAFSKRAIIAHQLVHCLTEIFVDRALARAAELDDHLKKTGKVVGPLHGLPISLKDQLCIKGLETTIGYASLIGQYADKNAVLVDVLIECGAVPFVRTNVPQTLAWPESFNYVFGRTTNPYNRSLTSGGSSGGEGALIALKGSPLGVGSDLGGSIRIPSAFCGLYGLKPSYGRVPYSGTRGTLEGQDSLVPVLGPMTNSVVGVKAFMKAVVNAKPWLKDPLVVRKKWDEDEYNLADHGFGKDLCFAIMWDNGVVVPHPPIRRALEITKAALQKAGHKVVDWKPIKHRELGDITASNIFYTMQRGIMNAASAEEFMITTSVTGEPLITTMELDDADTAVATFRPQNDGLTVYQLWQVQKLRQNIRMEYLDHWEATVSETGTGRPVDAIICPAAPFVATPHGKNRSVYVDYTIVWNALDYPAAVFPVTTVDSTLDGKAPPHGFYDDFDKDIYEMYDPEKFKNAPVCLQLVGRTLEEEAVIRMTEIVDAAVAAAK
ncbi:general amidase [Suillus clintonianus]|uniref:general amidase n=1 Tax=Suillus clintonianus TaxID=1904413 RepID=UPI001B8745F6|nr:general amidase [Suillus clintonianus]KAG2145199.1 general amidase [Suillus clintonianus]